MQEHHLGARLVILVDRKENQIGALEGDCRMHNLVSWCEKASKESQNLQAKEAVIIETDLDTVLSI